jgi:hypothetical protein
VILPGKGYKPSWSSLKPIVYTFPYIHKLLSSASLLRTPALWGLRMSWRCGLGTRCQQSRRARLAIDSSIDWVCISHASDVLGTCVMITSALLNAGERKTLSLVQREAWHDTQVVFFVASHTIFLSSFFRFDVLLRPRKLHIVDSSSNPRDCAFLAR